MRIAVCGGAYANPYALQAFVDDARRHGCERLYCLGDLGGFGADVDGLWPILSSNDVVCVAGNYDVAIARADPDCGCGYHDPRDNAFAQLIYDHTLAHTGRRFAAWMGGLPTQRRLRIGGTDVHLVHGSPLALNDFWWESRTEEQHRQRVAASGADVILCTHSGLPWQRRVGATLVVNVGVIGKPANDGRTSVWYAVLDLGRRAPRAELVRLAYDWRAQARSMRAAGLPELFVETIETGWWTTCLEVLPPVERARGRYHLYRDEPAAGSAKSTDGWAPPEPLGGDTRPVTPLFGTTWFPARLWLYTNFHCNLSCDYCAVASSPRAAPRTLTPQTFRYRVEEAVAEGFTELYLTGGEPLLHPDLPELLETATAALPTTLRTNAMLLRGRRLARLTELIDRPLTIQTSLDGALAATHDAHRGTGSWQRTIEGIARLADLGHPPLVALTETEKNRAEVPAVAALLERIGVPADHLVVRPLLRRGASAGGVEIGDDSSIPELTVTTDGLHWHPAGADVASSPDMHLAGPGTALAEGKRLVTERFLAARLADGTIPQPVNCAI
jgi:predicted phosphodiesterase/pyruvate-formate lyase-activating enzyme